jgi:NADH dehydrogenase
MSMILVVGATGVLGREVTKRLLADGCAVRATTRHPDSADDLRKLGAEVVYADLTDRASLARACDGAGAVLAAAHSLMGTGKYASKAVDDEGHRALIDAAKAAGVERFVYTSARGATSDHPVDFMRTKVAIEGYLRESGVDYTILRPSAFMEWHVHRLLGRSILQSGTATVFGTGNASTNFIAAEDLARYACIALTAPGTRRRTYDVGGPDNVSRRDVVAMYERLASRRAKVRYVPLGVIRVMSPLLASIAPVPSRLMAMSVWSETTDQTFDPSTLPQELPAPRRHVDDFVRNAISANRP